MARKPRVILDEPGMPENAAAITAAIIEDARTAEEEQANRDLVNQLLGQAQASKTIKQISQTLEVSKLAYVKETKLYRSLKGTKTPNNLELSGTWEEFCEMLGMSDEKANQDIANLRAFGEEALESMSRMGIGYRDLRQFRRLPDDAKTALIEVAKTGDKDDFIELAEEIISKHTAEKEAIEEDLQAKEELLTEKNQRIDELKQQLSHVKKLPPDAVLEKLQKETTSIMNDLRGGIVGELRQAVLALWEHKEAHDGSADLFAAGVVGQLIGDLESIRGEFSLPEVNNADETSWTQLPD